MKNRVKNYSNGYCVVALKYWQQYEENAYVDWFTTDEDEAERVRLSLARADRMTFIIVEV